MSPVTRLPSRSRAKARHSVRPTAFASPYRLSSLNSKSSTLKLSLAFTLIELLVVIAIIAILAVLVTPALTSRKSADDITAAAYTIAGTLEQARNFAMANNTYTWVGFYEEAATATSPTNTTPPYTGAGRVLIAAVASTEGTKIFDNSDPVAPLPSANLKQLGKLIKIEGVHLTDIGPPPTSPPSSIPSSDTLEGRSDFPYTYAKGVDADHYNRISSESDDATRFRFTAQNYTFYKTIRFSPRGEINLNSTYGLKQTAEIGLRPTHGSAVDNNARNIVAIQFNGIGGNVKIYRR